MGVHTNTSSPSGSDPAGWEGLYASFTLDGATNDFKIQEEDVDRGTTSVGYTEGMTMSMIFTDSSSAVGVWRERGTAI